MRAMTVRRTLPTRGRTLIGAWCFLDHYGPDDVAETGGMTVASHPHTGLQTVSWLFTGEIEHRDSAGHRAMVWPGEMNLMTAGRGISHSEVSTPNTTTLHGAQLWVALPDGKRAIDPGFEHYAAPLVEGEGWVARVFLGSTLGETSPVATHTPLLGAEVTLECGTTLRLPVEPSYEHGVLVDSGAITVDDVPLASAELGYVPPGAQQIEIRAAALTRLLLLGGTPLGERIVMWWNFVGRDHAEIAEYRRQWQELIGDGGPADGHRQERFLLPDDDRYPPIPAPELPRNVRLTARG
ncbi:MAG: pirin family protein [Actinomycetota bacterium]|nr:pirin family protein [Actinomycetota bacterium]